MVSSKAIAALAALGLLVACEARIGKSDDGDKSAARSVDGKAEEGSVSIKVPGFDMKVDIPEALADRAEIDSDSEIIYPGSKLGGVHVEAGEGEARNGVELRFTSADPPAKVAQWYRSSDRSDKFAITSEREEAGGYVLTGADRDDGDPFTLRLSPSGGGTDGQLMMKDKN